MLIDPLELTRDELTVRFDDAGTPHDVVAVFDLDGITDHDELTALVARRPDRIGLVGLARRPLPREAAGLLAELTTTLVDDAGLVPAELAAMTVTVPDPPLVAAAIVSKAAVAPRATVAALGLLAADLSLVDGVVMESLAHSMLLAGPELAAWYSPSLPHDASSVDGPVLVERTANRLDIVLNRPGRRNVIDRRLRAELLDALRLAEDDATITEVVIRGNGPSFSGGTDLDELGETTDVAAAHARGLGQSVGLALHRVADRVTVELHGPCFGAGIEVPAFASRIVAQPGTTVGLPALGMGLVPGDGGTASIRRRIGPWRTAFMVLSGATVGLEQALDWGLVDERSTDAAG